MLHMFVRSSCVFVGMRCNKYNMLATRGRYLPLRPVRVQLRDAALFCVLPIVGISYYCADL